MLQIGSDNMTILTLEDIVDEEDHIQLKDQRLLPLQHERRHKVLSSL